MTQSVRPTVAASPRKKRGGGGCGTVLLMFAGVGVMGGIVFVVSLVRAFSTGEGQELTRGYSEVANLVVEAQIAPGAEDVGKAGGCLQSLVMDADKLATLSQNASRDAGKRGPEKTLVTCQVGFAKAPPECQALAQVYVRSAHPTAPFRIAVQKQGDPNRTCDRVFDEKGQPLAQTTQTTQTADDAAAALPATVTVTADGGAN